VTERVYSYITYTLANIQVDDTNCLTPKQEREIVRKWQEAMDRSMLNALSGGSYVQPTFGTTFDHRPRRRLEKP